MRVAFSIAIAAFSACLTAGALALSPIPPSYAVLTEQSEGMPTLAAEGSVSWFEDTGEFEDSGAVGVLKGTGTIPDADLKFDVLLRANTDGSIPATHIIEINFDPGEGFGGGSVATVAGIMLKDDDLAQGTPLIGAGARVIRNAFLFALSEEDVARNVDLLNGNGWIDIAVVYETGERAILTLELSKVARQVIEELMAS